MFVYLSICNQLAATFAALHHFQVLIYGRAETMHVVSACLSVYYVFFYGVSDVISIAIVWHHAEKVLVVVNTETEQLGQGDFTFLPGSPQEQSLSIHLNMVSDDISRRLLNAIQRGADHRVSSGAAEPSSGHLGVSITGGHVSTRQFTLHAENLPSKASQLPSLCLFKYT